jgi:O-antigen/teichoic acid export membrane protein
MCASLLVDQGFNSYGAREIAKEPDKTPQLFNEIVTARFLLAATSYAAIVLFAYFYVDEPVVRTLLLVYGLSLWVLPLLLQWVFQGHDRMNLVAVIQIVRQSVFVFAVVVFVRTAADLIFVGVAEVAGVTAAAIVSIWFFKRYFVKRLRPRVVLSKQLFRVGVPIGIGQMFWVVRMFGATLIVGLVATAEDTGYFAGAMRIFIALHAFVWLYFFNLLPSMSRAWIDSRQAFSELTTRSMRLVVVACIGVGLVWILTSTFVMSVAFGPDFSKGGAALQWLAGAWISAAISGHFRFGLIAAGRQNKEMAASAMGAVAAAVLIPIGYFQAGIEGSAAGLFVAEMVVLVFSWIFSRELYQVESPENPVESKKNGLERLGEVVQ